MFTPILITCENGSRVKTYGLSRLEIYNMKFPFLCIVIVISCSVCASGDLKIYPGLKLDLLEDEQRRLENSDESSSYQQHWLDIPLADDYGDDDRIRDQDFDFSPERLFQSKKQRQHQFRKNDEVPYYYNPTLQEIYEELRNLENARRFEQFHFGNQHVLDDVRPYPLEDDFKDEDYEERTKEDDLVTKAEVKNDAAEVFSDVKFAEDPTMFAYSPTDSRFFEDSTQPDQKNVKSLKDNINLYHRSDEKFAESTANFADHSNENFDNNLEIVAIKPHIQDPESAGVYIIAIVAGISAAATVGLIAVGIGWYNLQKHVKSATDVEYPAYGVTGPNKDTSPSGDRRLAQSAQMYHYQHQKQQIIAMESNRAAVGERHGSVSDADSDEENEEGDYTVYECPGLAPTGEMEVKNPLFQDDPTPAQTPPVKSNEDKKE